MIGVHESKIKIESRQRRLISDDAIQTLKQSIQFRGLLHAIVVRKIGEEYRLIAGERRLRAMKELHMEAIQFQYDGAPVPLGRIPCTEITASDEIGFREAELEENIIREDLTWQEKVSAIDELHRLRREQNPNQMNTETAQEISEKKGGAVKTFEEMVSKSTVIAPFLDDPDVKRANTMREAFNIVSRKIEAEFSLNLSRITPPSEHLLIHDDIFAPHAAFANKKFTCIISDPPYGIDANSFGDAAAFEHGYADDVDFALAVAKYILYSTLPHCADQAHIFMFCDIEHYLNLRESARAAGWNPMRTPIIWQKLGGQGHIPDGSIGFRRSYECILFASKGGKKIQRVVSDIISIAPEQSKLHAAQKPVELYKFLLSLSCLPGDYVLDPTCGSGTIFRAAHALKLKAVGIEKDERYAGYARAAIVELTSTSTSSISPRDESESQVF